jgi:hypothetical protein
MKAMLWLIAVGLLGALAWLWQRHGGDSSRPSGAAVSAAALKIAGGDGGGLPRALPADEQLDAQSLANAAALAEAGGARVLLVARHGHLLIERYANDAAAQELVDGGDMSAAVLALVDNNATQISRRLWQPLNAHAAWLDGCCIKALPTDWLRLGILLAQDGRYEGSDIVTSGVIARLRTANGATAAGSGASGAEPFAVRNVYYLRGPDRMRLWIAPDLQIVALHVGGPAGANGWDETQLFNQILRAAADRSTAASGDLLNQLVPGH